MFRNIQQNIIQTDLKSAFKISDFQMADPNEGRFKTVNQFYYNDKSRFNKDGLRESVIKKRRGDPVIPSIYESTFKNKNQSQLDNILALYFHQIIFYFTIL